MLSINPVDGLTTVRNPATNDVWLFDDEKEAGLFIMCWFAEDIRSIYDA